VRPIRWALAALCLAALLQIPDPALALARHAREAGIYDVTTGEWIFEKSIDKPVPIASITKVAAALTTVSLVEDLDRMVTVTREDWLRAGRTKLRVGDRVPLSTLLRLALVASDNCAARALAHGSGLSREAFGYKMQELAWGLGCRRTQFVEPTGLDPRNVACVRDVVILFREAMATPEIREVMGTTEFMLPTRRGARKVVHSSRMLRYRHEVVAAKTGYLAAAGYCLVQYVEDERGPFITVVLGTPSRGARIRESTRLIEYTRRKRI
jgi:D-alanyl-D-alanine endopeptidase (penicillin-binding protein 7)